MSLLDSYAQECVFIEKNRISDGAGGFITEYTEGASFTAYIALDTSMQARIAEKQGVTSSFSVLCGKSVPLEYSDIFKNKSSGTYYRVTSRPEEKQTPASSTMALLYCTAERWIMPT